MLIEVLSRSASYLSMKDVPHVNSRMYGVR
jgi:hypothetical protein